ncbi:MAG: hypothetical protein KAG61_08905 [Bacteriovoracaceae bacterium]|nr:hypothetical protein [Bacteriovoracaceae bacterium]
MNKFFIENLHDESNSVTVSEFKEFGAELFSKHIETNPDLGICSILDTETTGLDHKKDQIIEIAIRKWVYHKRDHCLIKPLGDYSQLNEPVGIEISEEITEITGITNSDVKGQKIDWSIVSKIFAESDFVLAHNAGFDRPMVEEVPEVREVSSNKIWTCSFKQVDWSSKGFMSSKQELLALFHGFHYSGHRALVDVDALGNILLKGDYLKEILANAKTKQVQVNCVGAPFDSKDILKSNKFSWNGEKKFWSKVIPERELDEMKNFLNTSVYAAGKMKAQFNVIEIRDRFKMT